MTQRSAEDLKHELEALDQAHSQNEAARDSFVALAHTALFAASVSFVGSAVPLAKAVWPVVLIAGWSIDVLGLLALTASFATAHEAINARRAALYADTAPLAAWSDRLNGFALWSFPAALLCLFSFVTANVVHINEQPTEPSRTSHATAVRIERTTGNSSANAGTSSPRWSIGTTGGGCACAQGTGSAAPIGSTASTTRQKVGASLGGAVTSVPHGTP